MKTFATLARSCLERDAGRTVAAFTVDASYVSTDAHEGLPLVAFDLLPTRFPPAGHDVLIPLGFRQMNGLRIAKCAQAKAMGYTLASYVSSRAIVWPETAIGENVLIYEQANLQPFVTLGPDVTVRAGVNIGHHSVVGDHCFIASGAVTGGKVTIGARCCIGLGAVIRDGVRIADRCFIGAGAVVVSDTEPDGVYVGNPAKRMVGKISRDVTM
ncbi:acetyltransferase [Rhodoferax sp.]|uniref:acetyltransferase n=1 Tax=Rhodoferax sp. TaxID=50421 RepID=UPI00260DCC55|nr:acetyltransferase [Rhodoferax sp.]MDD2919829.1 acetyltransferase [Rhodoferax sp.]